MNYIVYYASNGERATKPPHIYKNPKGWTEMYLYNPKEGDVITLDFLYEKERTSKFPKYPYTIGKIEHKEEKNYIWVYYSGDLDESVFN